MQNKTETPLYFSLYTAPFGLDPILLFSDGTSLCGLFFTASRDGAKILSAGAPRQKEGLAVFAQTRQWLDSYFSGHVPDSAPPYCLTGLTPFRQSVTARLLEIPYGQTVSYGNIARDIAAQRGMARLSAQVVGGAVGRNPIGIIIPCHRVIGTNGTMTGYSGGLSNKIKLLALEKTFAANAKSWR